MVAEDNTIPIVAILSAVIVVILCCWCALRGRRAPAIQEEHRQRALQANAGYRMLNDKMAATPSPLIPSGRIRSHSEDNGGYIPPHAI